MNAPVYLDQWCHRKFHGEFSEKRMVCVGIQTNALVRNVHTQSYSQYYHFAFVLEKKITKTNL